ncbi:UNVERIFIED_CONTAM: hypothetical protein NCL1_31410 [Trichonephila clavipes]
MEYALLNEFGYLSEVQKQRNCAITCKVHESKNIIPDDPADDLHFKEPDIDNMRAQKKKELTEYRKKQKNVHKMNM